MISKLRSTVFGSYNTYYVATTGNNSNDGLTTATAWATLTYAASESSPVVAGDTVYIKAGNYGNENIVFAKSGIKGAPISFIGYKTTPGDRPPLLYSRANADQYNAYVSTDMPTYNGSSRSSGVWLDLNTQKYIVLKNLQGATYLKGTETGLTRVSTFVANNEKTYLDLYNIGCMTLGSGSGYSGHGLTFGSLSTRMANGNKVSYCVVVNAGAEAFCFNGDYNSIEFCKSFCNETTSSFPTDYYFMVSGNYNITKSCYIERATAITGGHHGFTVKTNAEDVIDAAGSYPTINCTGNQFYNCSTYNMPESFCVRHRGATYNNFYKCYALGTHTGSGGGGVGQGIMIRDGASNNTFEAIKTENCHSGILFLDTVEDGGAASPVGSGNIIKNCVFDNTYIGINHQANVASDSGANTIANCTFYKTRFHIDAARNCTQMVYKNIIFYGGAADGNFNDGAFEADVVVGQFSNCVFYSITGGFAAGFTVGGTTAGLTSDPLFVDAANGDFRLGASSPAKDAGLDLTYVLSDYSETARITTDYSIGAFERA